jgi:hypothetical protein
MKGASKMIMKRASLNKVKTLRSAPMKHKMMTILSMMRRAGQRVSSSFST